MGNKINIFGLILILNTFCVNSDKTQDSEELKYNSDNLTEIAAQLEKRLLPIFGLKKRPKVDKSKVVIPEALLKLFDDIQNSEYDSVNIPRPGLHTQSANTVRSFNATGKAVRKRMRSKRKFQLFFNVSSIPETEQLKAAEIMLNMETIGAELSAYYQIRLYDILKPGKQNFTKPVLHLIDAKSIEVKNLNDTISLDPVDAVIRWKEKQKQNYGLLFEILKYKKPESEKRQKRSLPEIDESEEAWMKKQPLLFTYTDDGKFRQRSLDKEEIPRRSKRQNPQPPLPRRRKVTMELCQRKPLYVDFSLVGWDAWVVAPRGYDAFFCEGECVFPLGEHMNSTAHAVIQTLINSVSPTRVQKPCCIPTELTSLSILFLDQDEKVVLKNYKDMVVVGCGCR